ncbi:MAG: DNA recombination protein RmuC [Cyclobacteriaceae bacterium]
MDLTAIVLLAVGLVSGGAIGFLVARLTSSQNTSDEGLIQAKAELSMERESNERLNADLIDLNDQLKTERSHVLDLNSSKATLEANYQNLQTRLVEQKKEISELQDRFALQFRNLANDIFEEKNKQSKTNLHDLLKPLGEKISEFEKKVDLTNKESIERNTALREQIVGLRDLNIRITKEAENLTKALKGDTRLQGSWGEVVLERILEQSGLEKDREYFTQESLNTNEGRRLRPDVIIKLPENKNLVIDSKVTLIAYERYANAETDEEKEQFLKDHLIAAKAHIKSLSEKNYNQLFDGGTLDYVLMFIPIEAAFSLIVQHGGGLYNEAHDKNIIIVSPTTLIATLRTVASIWKHEYQNRNALEIARQGGALYDKFKAFVDDLVKVGQSIKSTQSTYEEAMKKLHSGKDNLIRKTERLRELGAKTTKIMDQKLLDRADVDAAPAIEPASDQQADLFGT